MNKHMDKFKLPKTKKKKETKSEAKNCEEIMTGNF